jgi:hypothetical protein
MPLAHPAKAGQGWLESRTYGINQRPVPKAQRFGSRWFKACPEREAIRDPTGGATKGKTSAVAEVFLISEQSILMSFAIWKLNAISIFSIQKTTINIMLAILPIRGEDSKSTIQNHLIHLLQSTALG